MHTHEIMEAIYFASH